MNLPSLPVTQEDLTSLAAARGEDKPNVAWILTPFDTWEPNPFYTGPKVPHPEVDDY